MKIAFKLLIITLFISTNVFSQIDPYAISSGVGLGGALLSGIRDKKKLKNIEQSISDTIINGTLVFMLRVKENKILSNAKYHILKIQDQLDSFHSKYLNNQHIGYIYDDDNDVISSIESLDNTWPVYYYKKELIAYRNFEKSLMQREKATRDSIEALNGKDDSLKIIKKENIDGSTTIKKLHFDNSSFTFLSCEMERIYLKCFEENSTVQTSSFVAYKPRLNKLIS